MEGEGDSLGGNKARVQGQVRKHGDHCGLLGVGVVALNPKAILIGDKRIQLSFAGSHSALGPTCAKWHHFIPLT